MGSVQSRIPEWQTTIFNQSWAAQYRRRQKADCLHPLKRGDHIEFPRCFSLYRHHAIAVSDQDLSGNIEVVDFNMSEGITTVGKRWKNVYIEDMYKVEHGESECYSVDEVVRRAESRIGTTGYSFISKNCEHETMFAKTGKYESLQVNDAVRMGVNLGIKGYQLKEEIDKYGWTQSGGKYRFSDDQSWRGNHARVPGCSGNYYDTPPMPSSSNNHNLSYSGTSNPSSEGSPVQMYNMLMNRQK